MWCSPKKDEDHVTGKALGMFDASGERVKANTTIIKG
jgi:hypothetical protein